MTNSKLTGIKAKKTAPALIEREPDWLHYLSMWEAELGDSQDKCQKCTSKTYCPKCFPCSLK